MKQRVRQHVTLAASVAAILLLRSSHTQAIINGTLDGNLHPTVGAVVPELNGQTRQTPTTSP
jgi:hypothetical protein